MVNGCKTFMNHRCLHFLLTWNLSMLVGVFDAVIGCCMYIVLWTATFSGGCLRVQTTRGSGLMVHLHLARTHCLHCHDTIFYSTRHCFNIATC